MEKRPLYLGRKRSEGAKEVVYVVRGIAYVSQVNSKQARGGFRQDGHRRRTLRDLRLAARRVARFVGADDQTALATGTTRAQHGAHAQQGDRTAGAGVFDVEGGDRLGNRKAGTLQHSVHVGYRSLFSLLTMRHGSSIARIALASLLHPKSTPATRRSPRRRAARRPRSPCFSLLRAPAPRPGSKGGACRARAAPPGSRRADSGRSVDTAAPRNCGREQPRAAVGGGLSWHQNGSIK